MPTIKEVLNRVKLPGEISDSIKVRWLGELDKIKYRYPDDVDMELAFKPPHDHIYDLYLRAMNDFFTGDMANYSASAIMFEQAYAKRGVK
jgi:hypothetical protein